LYFVVLVDKIEYLILVDLQRWIHTSDFLNLSTLNSKPLNL